MTRFTWITVATVSALAVSAGAAMARGPQGELPAFESFDADNNGEITRAEMDAQRAARFSDADINGDGVLDRAELIARGEARLETRADRMIDRMDSNDDGVLSAEELNNRRDPGRMFSRMDRDDNGSISKAEFEEMTAKMRDRMAKRQKKSGSSD